MELELPFPPSVNHLWRRGGRRTYLSRAGQTFRRAVQAVLVARGVRPIAGPLAVIIEMHPPDRRRRDLDNGLKALLDALQHGGAYYDDAQIDDLHIKRGECVPGGRVCVRLVPLTPADASAGGAKPRTCLKCGKLFESAGPGNRICQSCDRSNARIKITQTRMERGVKRRNKVGLDGDTA